MRVCDAAFETLLKLKMPSVMYGDEGFWHEIAERLGWEHEGLETTRRLLRALSKTPGRLVKSYCRMPSDCRARGQAVLCFELPEPEYGLLMAELKRPVLSSTR